MTTEEKIAAVIAEKQKEKDRLAKEQAMHNGFKQWVGKTLTDGIRRGYIREYLPQHLIRTEWIPSFLVTYQDNPNAGFFVGAEEFLATFKLEDSGEQKG